MCTSPPPKSRMGKERGAVTIVYIERTGGVKLANGRDEYISLIMANHFVEGGGGGGGGVRMIINI